MNIEILNELLEIVSNCRRPAIKNCYKKCYKVRFKTYVFRFKYDSLPNKLD